MGMPYARPQAWSWARASCVSVIVSVLHAQLRRRGRLAPNVDVSLGRGVSIYELTPSLPAPILETALEGTEPQGDRRRAVGHRSYGSPAGARRLQKKGQPLGSTRPRGVLLGGLDVAGRRWAVGSPASSRGRGHGLLSQSPGPPARTARAHLGCCHAPFESAGAFLLVGWTGPGSPGQGSASADAEPDRGMPGRPLRRTG